MRRFQGRRDSPEHGHDDIPMVTREEGSVPDGKQAAPHLVHYNTPHSDSLMQRVAAICKIDVCDGAFDVFVS